MQRLTTKHLSLLVVLSLSVTAQVTAQCSRRVQDLLDPYGGANDLDGDGNFNLTDMIVGLRFLFAGTTST